jgi:hypothetical protein
VDLPDGGHFTMKNCILTKNFTESNGGMLLFGEGYLGRGDTNPTSMIVENNTFVIYSPAYDTFGHKSYATRLFNGALPPDFEGAPPTALPVRPFSFKNNVFVGCCAHGNERDDYRGEGALIADFTDLNADFSLNKDYHDNASTIVGTIRYRHAAQAGPKRSTTTLGAMDVNS